MPSPPTGDGKGNGPGTNGGASPGTTGTGTGGSGSTGDGRGGDYNVLNGAENPTDGGGIGPALVSEPGRDSNEMFVLKFDIVGHPFELNLDPDHYPVFQQVFGWVRNTIIAVLCLAFQAWVDTQIFLMMIHFHAPQTKVMQDSTPVFGFAVAVTLAVVVCAFIVGAIITIPTTMAAYFSWSSVTTSDPHGYLASGTLFNGSSIPAVAYLGHLLSLLLPVGFLITLLFYYCFVRALAWKLGVSIVAMKAVIPG